MRRAAAAVAIVAAMVALACGERDERVPDVAPADARQLAASGLVAVDAAPGGASLSATIDGATLRMRSSSPPHGGLAEVADSFESLRVRVVPFCPKPALLRCRPALQASGVLRAGRTVGPVAVALRRLAARTYEQRPLPRGRPGRTEIVTANGELLAVVRAHDHSLSLAFGGPVAPRLAPPTPPGRLVVEAGPGAIAAIRPAVGPAARRALAGVRRLRADMPLPTG